MTHKLNDAQREALYKNILWEDWETGGCCKSCWINVALKQIILPVKSSTLMAEWLCNIMRVSQI